MEAARGPRAREGGQHGETGPGPGPGLDRRKRGAGGASGAKNFFVAVGDGAPETNDVSALSADDRGTSVRTAPCCSAGIDDQAQTPQSARFSEEQRKIREVSQNFGVHCVQLSDSVDVFSESVDVEDVDDVELVPFSVERESASAEEEVRVMHDSLCVDDQSGCLGEEWYVRQDVGGWNVKLLHLYREGILWAD